MTLNVSVTKTGDWKGSERKLKGMKQEIHKSVANATESIPKAYKTKIKNKILTGNVRPESEEFTPADYAEEIKAYPETSAGVTEIFVGVTEDAPPEIQDFALSAEFESSMHLGIWRKVSTRFTTTVDKLRDNIGKQLASWR